MRGVSPACPSPASARPSSATAALHCFARDGFLLLPDLLGEAEARACASAAAPSATLSGGTRTLLQSGWCVALVQRLRRHAALAPLLPANAVAVQCTYFEKSTGRNWLVPWHQDLSLPVAGRVEHPALRGWSVKEGVLQVQPPAAVLEQVVAVRLHLDDCGPDDGPLRVLPGSHRGGVRPEGGMAPATMNDGAVVCTAPLGAALLMRPLLLHASSKATGTSLRRVLHLLFAPPVLPLGLQWHHAV
jgi:hypothetical protein